MESYRACPPGELVKARSMDALTPASADDLPPLGELIVDDPFWEHPAGAAREDIAHLRVWGTATVRPGYLAVVTETGGGASITESASRIWAVLAGRFGPSLVLLEHHLAPVFGEGTETLDLVRVGADGSPHWSRIWPTPEDNPGTWGLSSGWLLTGTKSSAGPRAGSTGARTRAVAGRDSSETSYACGLRACLGISSHVCAPARMIVTPSAPFAFAEKPLEASGLTQMMALC